VTHVDSILSAWNGASVCTSLFDKPQISIVSRPCCLHSSESTYLQKKTTPKDHSPIEHKVHFHERRANINRIRGKG
jgi:hypothetical protein